MKQFTLLVAFIALSTLVFGQSKQHSAKNTQVKKDTTLKLVSSPQPVDLNSSITYKRIDTIPGAVTIIVRTISGPKMNTYQSFEIDSIFTVTEPQITQDNKKVIYDIREGKKIKGVIAVTDQGSIFIDQNKWFQFIPSSLIQ